MIFSFHILANRENAGLYHMEQSFLFLRKLAKRQPQFTFLAKILFFSLLISFLAQVYPLATVSAFLYKSVAN
jgi:hypothetical protein